MKTNGNGWLAAKILAGALMAVFVMTIPILARVGHSLMATATAERIDMRVRCSSNSERIAALEATIGRIDETTAAILTKVLEK